MINTKLKKTERLIKAQNHADKNKSTEIKAREFHTPKPLPFYLSVYAYVSSFVFTNSGVI